MLIHLELIGAQKRAEKHEKETKHSLKPRNEERHHRQPHRKNTIETKLHEPSTQEAAKLDLPDKHNRYKWINTSATYFPTTPKLDDSSSSSSKSKSATQSEHAKDDAVQFLKDKLSKRKVHINKHHATFKNRTLSAITSSGIEEKDKVLNCDRTSNKKQAAVDFLKQAGVISGTINDEAIRKLEPHIRTKRHKTVELERQNLKVDRRPKKLTSITQKSKELVSGLSPIALSGQRKLLIEKTSTCPQHKHLNKEGTKSDVFGLHQKQNKFKFVRSVSDPSSSSNGSSKVNRYKVVRNRTTPTRQLVVANGANAQNNLISFSKYKLVKSENLLEVEQKSFPSSGVCNIKCATGESKHIPTKSKYKWTKEDSVNGKKRKSSVESVKLRAFNRDSYSTSRSIKKKTRFKLVRKSAKPTPVQSPEAVKAIGSRKCMNNSRYRFVYKTCRETRKGESLVWKNRFSLKRNNKAGKAIRYICVFGEL